MWLVVGSLGNGGPARFISLLSFALSGLGLSALAVRAAWRHRGASAAGIAWGAGGVAAGLFALMFLAAGLSLVSELGGPGRGGAAAGAVASPSPSSAAPAPGSSAAAPTASDGSTTTAPETASPSPTPAPTPAATADLRVKVTYTTSTYVGGNLDVVVKVTNKGKAASEAIRLQFDSLDSHADLVGCSPTCSTRSLFGTVWTDFTTRVKPAKTATFTVRWLPTEVGVVDWHLNVHDGGDSESWFFGDGSTVVR